MYDAIIVGARCAGAPTAMLLARESFRVLMVDRGTFPSDILSTHFIQPQGVGHLASWGLVDRVLATNCPPIHQLKFTMGDQAVVNPFIAPDGTAVIGLCPRRTVLDKILIDAAVEAGAELREQFLLEDLTRDEHGRVTGVVGRTHEGATVTEEARIVIGADGLHSKMARLVEPIEYNRVESLVVGYYSYFSGIDMDGVEIYFRPGAASLFFPTNDGNACIVAGRPHSYFNDFRSDLEGSFWKTLDEVGNGVPERVRAGHREERFSGSGDLPHFFRKPYGAGWALVGDAGLHIDPMQGLGISKAFSEVDMLVPALVQGLSGARPMDEALAGYHNRRDETWVPFTRENIAASGGLSGQTPPVIVPWSETPYAKEGVPA